MVSIIVLLIVFILIAVRQIGRIRFQLWQIMLLGAIAVLLTLQISPLNAFKSINLDVMLFLFGMFVIGRAMEESGYLSHLSSKLFRRANSTDGLVLYILFGMGFLSAFLMNDTLAIVGTPVVIMLAKKSNVNTKLLLFALAFAITIGSVMSPIGNPQNLLIAVDGDVPNPFITFLKYLAVPTFVNLFAAYLILKMYYRKHFNAKRIDVSPSLIIDKGLVKLCRISLALLVSLVLIKIVIVSAGIQIDFRLTYIALASALPIIIFSPKRLGIIRRIDWHTMIFFVAMFILMTSVWDSGFFQRQLESMNLNLTSVSIIMIVSVIASQFVSNVPLVALYMPTLTQLGTSTKELMALAAGSTIAGNLFILGAVSNVIIIHNAEKSAGETLTFFEFARIGLPLTIINILVYWLYLSFIM
ncbi:MAG: SLC13 family permease [Dehalococcoidia bacterium]